MESLKEMTVTAIWVFCLAVLLGSALTHPVIAQNCDEGIEPHSAQCITVTQTVTQIGYGNAAVASMYGPFINFPGGYFYPPAGKPYNLTGNIHTGFPSPANTIDLTIKLTFPDGTHSWDNQTISFSAWQQDHSFSVSFMVPKGWTWVTVMPTCADSHCAYAIGASAPVDGT